MAAIVLVAMLHLTAGACAQRWVVYKLTTQSRPRTGRASTIRLSDRGTSGAGKTKDPKVLRKVGKALTKLTTWLLIISTLVVISALIRGLVESVPIPGMPFR
jgi:hypothetical protein